VCVCVRVTTTDDSAAYSPLSCYIIFSRSDLPRISLFPVFTKSTDDFPVYFPLICIYRPSIIIIIIIIWYCFFPRLLSLNHIMSQCSTTSCSRGMQWDSGGTVLAVISLQTSWCIPIDYYLKHHKVLTSIIIYATEQTRYFLAGIPRRSTVLVLIW